MAAMGVEAERRHVLAREQDELGAEPRALQRSPLHVRRRILDAGDVRMRVAQADDGVDGEIDHACGPAPNRG